MSRRVSASLFGVAVDRANFLTCWSITTHSGLAAAGHEFPLQGDSSELEFLAICA